MAPSQQDSRTKLLIAPTRPQSIGMSRPSSTGPSPQHYDRVMRPPAQARRPWSRSRISYQLNHELPGLVSRQASPPTIPSSPPPTRSEQDSQQTVEQETPTPVARPESPVVRRVRFLPKSKQGAGNDRKHGGKQPSQQFGELDLWELLKNVSIEMTAAQPIAVGA